MSISSQQVQELREKTGVGMMDCKRALEKSNGDLEKAIQFLREKGKTSAAQKAGRTTGQGLVCSWIGPESKKGSLVEINCETDFVARTKEFQEFARRIALHAGEKAIKSVDSLLSESINQKETIDALLKEKIAKLGENIKVNKVDSLGGNGNPSLIGQYIHAPVDADAQCGSLGVLVEMESDQSSPEIQNLARELCMQVAAATPKWISRDNVPADVINKEKEIYKEQCKQSGKPEKAWDKILEGKLNSFFKQFCLLDQAYIRDSSGKTSVGSVIDSLATKEGKKLSIHKFARFKVGEE